MSLNDVWSDIRTVGRSLGVDDRAEAVVRRLQNELDKCRAEVASVRSAAVDRLPRMD